MVNQDAPARRCSREWVSPRSQGRMQQPGPALPGEAFLWVSDPEIDRLPVRPHASALCLLVLRWRSGRGEYVAMNFPHTALELKQKKLAIGDIGLFSRRDYGKSTG
jgi:hypothetical protein